ncbi:hypothetical protein [Lactococcus fujiensis]|uniref:hypothetical protein n=1 Tax=Lactococcus fujiensis TaxID=610251 RepID=UPI0006D06DF8|nr:hypothetical protein [Lactococcus fujiensis]
MIVIEYAMITLKLGGRQTKKPVALIVSITIVLVCLILSVILYSDSKKTQEHTIATPQFNLPKQVQFDGKRYFESAILSFSPQTDNNSQFNLSGLKEIGQKGKNPHSQYSN